MENDESTSESEDRDKSEDIGWDADIEAATAAAAAAEMEAGAEGLEEPMCRGGYIFLAAAGSNGVDSDKDDK